MSVEDVRRAPWRTRDDGPRVSRLVGGFRVAWTIARFARPRDRARRGSRVSFACTWWGGGWPCSWTRSRVPRGGAPWGRPPRRHPRSCFPWTPRARARISPWWRASPWPSTARKARGAAWRGRNREPPWCSVVVPRAGAREAGRVAGWRVECAYVTPGAWLSWRLVSLKRSQTVDFVRDRLSIQSEIPNDDERSLRAKQNAGL